MRQDELDIDEMVEMITDRDFQILRIHSWEWADRRVRRDAVLEGILWTVAIVLGAVAGYMVVMW